MSTSKSSNGKLPVFVYPSRIDFIIDTPQHHKQVFTIHNPYDFPTKFKLLTTQRYRYRVLQREGVIQEKHCTDVLVRLHNEVFNEAKLETMEHKLTSPNKYFVRDKLRFEVSDVATNKPMGNRDVECFIWRSKVEFLESAGQTGATQADRTSVLQTQILQDDKSGFLMNSSFDSDSLNNSINQPKKKPKTKVKQKYDHNYNGTIWVPVVAVVICLIILSLPKENDFKESGHWLVPDVWILKTSENQRLIASYILGILTMILVQYQQG